MILPPSGQFRRIGPIDIYHLATEPWEEFVQTTGRIMGYIKEFSGKVDLTIHQPVPANPALLTLSEIPNTTYKFYRYPTDPDTSATASLVDAFERTVALRFGFHFIQGRMWKRNLARALRNIVLSDSGLDSEAMSKACEEVIMNPELQWPVSALDKTYGFVPKFVETVKQMVVLLHSAHLDSKYKISRMSMCDDLMHVEDWGRGR